MNPYLFTIIFTRFMQDLSTVDARSPLHVDDPFFQGISRKNPQHQRTQNRDKRFFSIDETRIFHDPSRRSELALHDVHKSGHKTGIPLVPVHYYHHNPF